MIPVKTRVRVLVDDNSYTRGCYRGGSGFVRQVMHPGLNHQPPLTLYYVEMDMLPLDDYEAGGWWYQESEVFPIS